MARDDSRPLGVRTRLDFWFDAALLLGFTLAYSYGFTGIAIHEWLGIGRRTSRSPRSARRRG